MMNDTLERKNLFGAYLLIAAVVLGLFLVLRQIAVFQQARVNASMQKAAHKAAPIPLSTTPKPAIKKIVETERQIEDQDILEAYEKEERRPGLLQLFSVGERLLQKKVEGVEYVKAVLFRTQAGTGRILADVALHNDSAVPVTPRFQLMLFNAKGRFLCRDTILYITEDLAPGEKKIETMSLPRAPRDVAFYEIRQLD
ncbi:MAG TPA: hypothetical protein PK696_02920 [bacterium]|nr:hypothetical protein [bacterium]